MSTTKGPPAMAAATTETPKRKHPLLFRVAISKTTLIVIDHESSQVQTTLTRKMLTRRMTYSIKFGISSWWICWMEGSAFRRSTRSRVTTRILSRRSCRSYRNQIWRTLILRTAKSLKISTRHSNSYFRKQTVRQRKMTMWMQIWNSFHSSCWPGKNNKYNGPGSSKTRALISMKTYKAPPSLMTILRKA